MARRLSALAVCVSMVGVSMPVAAAQPEDAGDDAAAQSADATPTVGGRIAVLRFTGPADAAEEIRGMSVGLLEDQGFTAVSVRVDLEASAKKNKCEATDPECLSRIGAYLNKNAREPFNFFLVGDIKAPGDGQSRLLFFDIDKNAIVADLEATPTPNDAVLNSAIALALGQKAQRYQNPLPELSAEERAELDNPGDPEKTAEEVEEEKRILAKAQATAKQEARQAAMDDIAVDLKADFKELCRTGPRQDREVTNADGEVKVERDLRPPCSRGPFFGYWQPRTYVFAGATVASALTMGLFYGLSLGARGEYNKAKEAFEAEFGGESNPADLVEAQQDKFEGRECDAANEELCYKNLAGAVSDATYRIRRNALFGDVALGATIVLAGVTAIVIYQDRGDARRYLEQEKSMNIADFQLVPVFTTNSVGAAAGFRF